MKKVIIPALCIIMLTGCISREQADKRLERGCVAAAGVFLEDGYSVKSVKKSTFGPSNEFGPGYRDTVLTIVETDDWADLDKDVECVFAEDMGAFGLSHSAGIYQLKIDGETYGIENGVLLGDVDTHLKLTTAVENAMRTMK